MISYEPFFETLKKRGISQYKFIKDNNFSHGLLSRMRHNQDIKLSTVEYICKILECEPSEIFTFINDETDNNE